MSEKRTPISIYLTPRASIILNEYSVGSGYGSLSRTVEEIILAFDFTYNTIKEVMKYLVNRTKESKELTNTDKAILFTTILVFLQNMDNAVSRLYKEPQPNVA